MTSHPIYQEITLRAEKASGAEKVRRSISPETPLLILLAAGKGTRFGANPKCIAPVKGKPLSRHSIDAFRRAVPDGSALVLVGYRHEEVARALGSDNLYVVSENPTGGTAWAVYEAFCFPELLEKNPLLVISMGDRIVPRSIFERLLAVHRGEEGKMEAELTLLTARYDEARLSGKGRIIRDEERRIIRIVEERDIRSLGDGSAISGDRHEVRQSEEGKSALAAEVSNGENPLVRNAFLSLNEGNCPLYVLRAETLFRRLMLLTNDNAQGQYYLTDIVERIAADSGEIRSVTLDAADPAYEILCADVTRPADLPKLESALERRLHEDDEVIQAAERLRANRPAGQTASIRRQLLELQTAIAERKLHFDPEKPLAVGISGGRFRIAFMHPDMGRFYGPAWQIPIGAAQESGTEQIVVFMQEADDHRLHLHPLAEQFRESLDFIETDADDMYPDASVSDWYSYEEFGTRMTQRVLLSLGYFSDTELARRRREGIPLPPESLWVGGNMRRPFSLIGNALASMRTYRRGAKGEKIAQCLGKDRFQGLTLASTGLMPQGGFSCSSALTIAVKNGLNALFDFELSGDELIDLAAQAEYGTGVRAGSLDQATVQKGLADVGTLISSNPADHYALLGTYPFPSDRIAVIFPYTAPRDAGAAAFSGGFYASNADDSVPTARLTAAEMRKMTGKAAEIAAVLLRLPLDISLFDEIKADLLDDGELSNESRRKIADRLRALPIRIEKSDLEQKTLENLDFFAAELARRDALSENEAREKAEKTLHNLFLGWRNPILRRGESEERGVPLRAMVAYLYAETAKNFRLLRHPDEWIATVARSQRGDRCFDIDPAALPNRAELETLLDGERELSGIDRVAWWIEKLGALPFDYNAGLDDAALASAEPPDFRALRGGNFFRGLALVDLAEAFLVRAFGENAVAVRVNAAGQGDFFQVHFDTRCVSAEEIKTFLDKAYYQRFGIKTATPFIEVHPGGSAVGVRLSRYALLERLIRLL